MATNVGAGAVESAAHTAPAPYLAFLTFQNAIDSLEHGIPKKIDRTIWPTQAGMVQSQIVMALRFFGLVDQNDRPIQLLHDLVEKKDERKRLLAELVNVAYANIVKHDLTKMTPKMLDDAIDEYGVSGDTKRKAVTFFLKAAKFAEIPMPPLLSSQVRNTGPRKKRTPKPRGVFVGDMNGRADTRYEQPIAPSGGSSKTVTLRGGGAITLMVSADPFSMTAEDRGFVFGLIDQLQAYAAVDDTESEEGGEEEQS